jgi:NAD(P)-dependent dehydrogenase (short-subunit alcohol dehydrogenase family)
MGKVVFDFSGKAVLVTGASRGIGYGIAEAFARAGADLTILADDAPVEEAAARLAVLAGRKIGALRCDITEREAVRGAIGSLPKIDVLINNAGLERITPIAEPGEEVEKVFRRIVDINVMGTYFVTRDALPKILPGGRIIFTSSIWSRTSAAEFGAYVATKHAVLGFMRTMAKELGPRGINVNAVGPGWVRTDASMLSLRRMSERGGRSEQSILDELMNAQSLPGLMQPSDITELYLFLASDAARNITGQAFGIDRGEVQA